MDELQMLRQALPEAQGPSPEVVATGRALLTSNQNAVRPGGRRGRRVWMAGLAATAVGAAALVAVFGVGGPADRSSKDQPMSARQILLAAATTSEGRPSTTGRYWHAEIRNVPEPVTVEHGRIRYRLAMTVDQTNVWIARSPKDLSWYLQGGDPTFTAPTPADAAAWRRDGSPTVFIKAKPRPECCGPMSDGPDDSEVLRPWPAGKAAPHGWRLATESTLPGRYVKGPRSILLGESRHKVSVTDVMALPTEPARLKARLQALADPAALKSFGRTPTEGMYDAVRDLLILAPAPPKVRAAAFRLLATFPGINTLGKERDPLGREGIGLIVTDPSFRQGGSYQDRFIIDPATANILAVGNQNAPGNHNAYTPVSARWTNTAPTLPAQRVPDRQP
ncbi:CU044_5270 family protein [Actinoallomurus sp. CA-150999]|uniref:CU044_5270 family protein n=1 Tax=Actinoallomurus sp. CA-150999 TaxID=3239887 RepID=UPI003D8D17FB